MAITPPGGTPPDWPPRAAEPALLAEAIHIWRVDLQISPAQEAGLARLLDPEEQSRANRFRFAVDRRRFIASHAALRLLLGQLIADDPASLTLVTGLHGKPALGGGHAGRALEFNMSHSHELALIAVGRDQPLGVDVEQIRPIPEALGIATRFFSPTEQSQFAPLVGSQLEEAAFFACWTRKEAIIKCIGEGFQHPTQTFTVAFLPDEPVAVLDDESTGSPLLSWFLQELYPGDGYAGAVATVAPSPVHCWSWIW